jgi:hypothetical protein
LAKRKRSLAAVIAAISMVGEDLSRNRTDAPAGAGRGASTGLRDDEGMPLICPTCQVGFRMAAAAGYFAWGCFRYFWCTFEGEFSHGAVKPTVW